MTAGAVSRLWSISRAQKLWMFGLVIGLVGGYATLQISPVAAVPELLLLILVAAPSPRFSGAAGALVGHGAAWSWLLMTSSIFCQMSCSYTLAYGPAHLTDGPAWQRETWVWFALAVGILLAGLILTIWTARRRRQELRAS
jgi:hypothetical protein